MERKITLRQTGAFSKQLQQIGSTSHFHELAGRLQSHPELGDVIPGTGGLRKIRMSLLGRGSRGGARIIYIYLKQASELFFLWLYSKGEAEDLTGKEKKALAALAAKIKSQAHHAKKKEAG